MYRCTLGCDFDVCSVCHAAAHASATRAIAAREGPGWRLATQEDVETHGAALAQDANPTAAVSSFALAGGRVAQVERPRGLSGGPGSRYFCSASSPHCDGLPRLLTLTLPNLNPNPDPNSSSNPNPNPDQACLGCSCASAAPRWRQP